MPKWGGRGDAYYFVDPKTAWWGEGTPQRLKIIITINKIRLLIFFLSIPIWPKNHLLCSRCECVTPCWSTSEGLSPQLGKEASLLHLTPSTLSSPLPPAPPSHPSSVPFWQPAPPPPSLLPTTSLHGWLCLVLRSMHVCCLPWQTPQIESLSTPCSSSSLRLTDALIHTEGGFMPFRKWPHLAGEV